MKFYDILDFDTSGIIFIRLIEFNVLFIGFKVYRVVEVLKVFYDITSMDFLVFFIEFSER